MNDTNPNPEPTDLDAADEATPRHRRGRRLQVVFVAAAAVVAVAIAGGAAAAVVAATQPPHAPTTTAAPVAPKTLPAYTPLSAAAIGKLPAAVYNATIGGLIPATIADPPKTATAYELTKDVPVYGADLQTPVARLPHLNFLGQPTTVTAIKTTGAWSLVLTPARQSLPSQNGGYAPAQSAGWVRTDQLGAGTPLTARVIVSVGKQTLTVRIPGQPDQVFPAGVGTTAAPTPTGVTGVIQARYVDIRQDTTGHQLTLTTLHSAAKDEPYDGKDGGVIGIHYNPDNTGAVSHGCIRLTIPALNALTTLPTGTPVTITN